MADVVKCDGVHVIKRGLGADKCIDKVEHKSVFRLPRFNDLDKLTHAADSDAAAAQYILKFVTAQRKLADGASLGFSVKVGDKTKDVTVAADHPSAKYWDAPAGKNSKVSVLGFFYSYLAQCDSATGSTMRQELLDAFGKPDPDKPDKPSKKAPKVTQAEEDISDL